MTVGVSGRRFPALSQLRYESDSLALLPHRTALLRFLVGALDEVVLGVQCLLGEGRAVQVVLRAAVRET